MYYRYKTKGNSGNLLKYVFVALLSVLLVGILIKYHEDFMFWKYSMNKLENEINAVKRINAADFDTKEISQLSKNVEEYIQENPLNENAYYLAARLYVIIGEKKSGINFTRYIMSVEETISEESMQHFFNALQYIKKGFAIEENAARTDDTLLMLAKLYLYTAYTSSDELYELIRDVSVPEEIEDVQDRRLYGFLKVNSGDIEYGIDYISRYGSISSVEDRLFFAGVYKQSGQYTDAIVTYKNILQDDIQKQHEETARFALGEIYFAQSLYSEALEQFSQLLLSDPDNSRIKEYMAKTYRKLGDDETADTYM